MSTENDTAGDMIADEEFTPKSAGRSAGKAFKLALLGAGVGAAAFVGANADRYASAYADLTTGGDFGPTCRSMATPVTKTNFAGGSGGCCSSGMTTAATGCPASGCSSSCGGEEQESPIVALGGDVAPFLEAPVAL